MKIGFVVRNSGPEAVRAVRELPRVADDLGYSAVWLTDHVIGSKSFLPVYEPEWTEVLTSLAHIAATTSRCRIGVGVLVVPYRDPVFTAKVLSTIDNLSDGRLVVGVGTGWSKMEFAALGVFDHFEARGAVTDESIEIMRLCWKGGEVSWSGKAFNFRPFQFGPVPLQEPHPPIWVGGQSGPAVRRAARIGDAWHPTNISPAEVARLGAMVDEAAGHSVPRTLRLAITNEEIDALPALLAEYEAAGVVEIAIGFREHGLAPSREGVQKMATRLGLS